MDLARCEPINAFYSHLHSLNWAQRYTVMELVHTSSPSAPTDGKDATGEMQLTQEHNQFKSLLVSRTRIQEFGCVLGVSFSPFPIDPPRPARHKGRQKACSDTSRVKRRWLVLLLGFDRIDFPRTCRYTKEKGVYRSARPTMNNSHEQVTGH